MMLVLDKFWQFIGCTGSSEYVGPYERAVGNSLSELSAHYAEESSNLRSVFSELELESKRPVVGHTHGKSAAVRSSASAFADLLGGVSGLTPVFVQMSKTDQRKGRAGFRTYYWSKDLVAEAQSWVIGETDILVMIDVDYYYDDFMRFVATYNRPVLVYAFQPSQAGKASGEYKYSFDRAGTVLYEVSGGAKYKHKVWNFQGDAVVYKEGLCGIPCYHAAFALERKACDADHQLILLAPLGEFVGPVAAWWASSRLKGPALERLNPIEGDFVRLRLDTPDGMRVSTARVNGYYAATVPIEVDEAITLVADTTKNLTHATVKSKMAVVGTEEVSQQSGSEILHAYQLSRLGKANVSTGQTRERMCLLDVVHSYQYVKDITQFEPGAPSMVGFMNPLYDAAYVPERSVNNDKRTVQERVRKPQETAKKRATGLNEQHTRWVKDFANRLHRAIGEKLHPVDYETVYERQSKPTQRAILVESEHREDDGEASAMQKAEAYGKPNDPRNITVMNGPSKREHSKWMYALYDAMIGVRWYSFGKPPAEIAELLATCCVAARHWWLDTDFERLDGHVDKFARMVERMIMITLFHPNHHVELLASLRAQTFLNVKTKYGVKYNSQYSRASGSAETAVFNTILTALIFYMAFRMTRKPNGEFYNDQDAWDALGLYGGDDGGTADLPPENAEKAARIFGQKLTMKKVPRGEPGVKFLARHYGPGVWFGDTNSCCDLARQLSKFHVTPHLNKVSAEEKLFEKCFAFSLCDSESPVIGPFVKKVLVLTGKGVTDYNNKLGIWNSHLEKEVHYPNKHERWMDDILEQQLPGFDGNAAAAWIGSLSCVDDALRCPGFATMGAVPAGKPGTLVVDGEVYSRPQSDAPKPTRAERAANHPSSRPRKGKQPTPQPPQGSVDSHSVRRKNGSAARRDDTSSGKRVWRAVNARPGHVVP